MPLTKENQSIYSNHLHTVQNIKFSTKELAVISCIIHNRGTKKIANLLFISPNTVKSHTQNIMRKMNCNSRESIIDIIENSGKLVYFRQYYTNILIIALFRETLIKIAKIYIKDSLLLHINSSPGLNLDKIPIFQQLRIDLNLVNITIYQDKNTEENIIKINVVVDKMFNLQSIIFDKDRGEKTIDFQGSKIYYFAVLELLTAIVDKPGVVNFLEEFKKNYNILKTSVILPESVTPGDESVDKISLVHYDLINNKFKIFTLILLVCLVSHIVYANRIYIKSKIVSNTPVELSIITNEVAANNDIIKWNIPKCFEYYVNRPEVIAKIWQILQSKLYKKNITKITGLSGLGGIGKTTLAKLLINNPRIHYKFLAWFNADNEDVLRKSYFALGNNFNIFPANISDEAKIVLVQEWMSHQDKILIVYDNVPDISILEKFLPSKGHIIITSRHYQIPGMLALDVMTQDQSIDLLNRLIPESIQKSQNYSSNLKTLAKKLNYIPLALVQAGSYITENMINIEKYSNTYILYS